MDSRLVCSLLADVEVEANSERKEEGGEGTLTNAVASLAIVFVRETFALSTR